MPTRYLDPNGTVSNTNSIVDAPTAHEAVDDGIRQPSDPSGSSDRLSKAGSGDGTTVLDCGTFTLDAFEHVKSVKVWAYREAIAGAPGYTIKVLDGGVARATTTVNDVSGEAWISATWSSGDVSQAVIDGLGIHLQISPDAGETGAFYAAYLEVETETWSLPRSVRSRPNYENDKRKRMR